MKSSKLDRSNKSKPIQILESVPSSNTRGNICIYNGDMYIKNDDIWVRVTSNSEIIYSQNQSVTIDGIADNSDLWLATQEIEIFNDSDIYRVSSFGQTTGDAYPRETIIGLYTNVMSEELGQPHPIAIFSASLELPAIEYAYSWSFICDIILNTTSSEIHCGGIFSSTSPIYIDTEDTSVHHAKAFSEVIDYSSLEESLTLSLNVSMNDVNQSTVCYGASIIKFKN